MAHQVQSDRMKTITIGRRLNSALAALIVLFVVALGLAVWVGYARKSAAETHVQLELAGDRIACDLVAMRTATLGVLLDPASKGDSGHQNPRDDLSAQVDEVGRLCPNLADLQVARQGVRNFATGTLDDFCVRIEKLAQTDQRAAMADYNQTHPLVREEQTKVLEALNREIGNAVIAEDLRAQTASVIGYSCIVLIVIAGLFIVRVPVAAITDRLSRLADGLEKMERGDFTHRITFEDGDQFGPVGDGLNRIADDVTGLISQVNRSGIQVNTTATEIAATAKEQQSTANEIAATTAEIGATSRQISATSKELEKTMNEVSRVAQDTAQVANNGQIAIARMESTMRQIVEAASAITGKLAVLNERTGNVNSVVTTITKVADQTNLLSLNAAIEAEKAGEYGLGFAVVAMEIRRLADQTAVATYDIEKMVKEMQSAVASGVMGMDKFSEEVRRGVDEVRDVGSQLAQIIHQVQTLMPRFQAVNEGMHAQATGAQQISETLAQLSEAAHQTADSLRHSNTAIDQLNGAAHGLQTSVSRFRTKG
jgi:methyl-accepting chemotaxis protein WspA